LLLLLLYNYY